MKTFNIAIVGLGQIGSYLYNEIITKKKDIELKTGKKIRIIAISAKNKNKVSKDEVLEVLNQHYTGLCKFGGPKCARDQMFRIERKYKSFL